MNNNLTEIVFILDRSGSMGYLVTDTIGGFNSFVKKQKNEEGEANLTTVLFDNKYELLHDGADLKTVNPITEKEYFVRGTTALLDAIGISITTVKNRIENTPEEEKPSKVIFVITTDGYENASKEYFRPQISQMINEQTEKGWQFLFLGANIDAVSTAESFGINGQFASNYSANSVGTDSLYTSVSKSVGEFRSIGIIDADWKSEIK